VKKVYYFSNQEISQLLRSMAAAYEIKGEDRFRIAAYERAAASVEHATSEVKDLWDDKKLGELAGIGAAIASHLDELFRTGKVKHFDQVFKDLPPAMFTLLDLPGVGAKTAYKLCLNLKIKEPKKALSQLRIAAKKGRIRTIEGFGEETEKTILKAIKELRSRSERILLPTASLLAEEILSWLKRSKAVERVETLGSLRRQVATVGDIDIAVASNQAKEVIKHFVVYPKKKRVLESGEAKASILLKGGQQVDLMVEPVEAFGALLQHFTGSKHHNIALREFALKKKMSLSEHGIKKGGKLMKFKTEEEFYNFLSLDYIPPELRENTGEIEAAQARKLPKLIDLKDIKGDLHLHSNIPIEESHDPGTDTVEVMIEKAEALGYEYLGFTEHNPSISQHNEKQICNLLKAKKEKMEQINSSRTKKILKKVYNGLEVDIRPNGKLAIPDEAYKLLDYVIASIHSSFRMEKEEMTKRVLEGLSPEKAKILGHPTGRLLGKREGYELDWEKIFEFCLKKKKWIEINAHPARLDLPDILVREAIKAGVKIIINTDSHAVEQMDLMSFGVSVAKRGWAEKKDIVNCLSYNRFAKTLLS
jgi:DNA polymerase (family 10)